MKARRITPLGLLALASLAAHGSHDESIGARFVQPGGVDVGDCLDHHAPCVSIRYALMQAQPGNTVKVGAGIFDLSGIDPESYLHGAIHATGGYDEADHYLESRPHEVQSIVVGVDARYRNTLAVRGFHWAEDRAAAARGAISYGGGEPLQAAQAVPLTCVQGFAGAFPCRNIDFLAQISLNQFSSRPVSAANVWGFVDLNDNREYAVVGLRNGTAIVDVTDPVNPREVVTIPGNLSAWREVKVYQVRDTVANRWRAYAYVTTEAANSGLQTIDMSGLPQTAVLASTNHDTGSQHTLYVSNIDYATNVAASTPQPFLYVAGANVNGGSWRAYSLANPAFPEFAAGAFTLRYMHDSTSLYVTDGRTTQCLASGNPCEVLVDFNVDQVEIWNVTNKLAPLLIGAATNPNNRYIHSGWPTANGRYLFFHDELEEIQFGLPTRIYALDLSDLRSPRAMISYTGATSTTDHNGYTRGDYYYVSHYRRGVVVFDATDPANLIEVGHFDGYLTPAENVAGTDGAWGVYPFLPSGTLLVSDIENGLFVLRDHAQTLRQNVGRVGFAELAVGATEGSISLAVRVRRVMGSAGAVSVQFAAGTPSVGIGAPATEGADYTAASGTLTWGDGDLADKIAIVPLIDDTTIEGLETLTVTLSAPSGGAILDGASALTVTLTDNDTAAPPAGGGGGGGGGAFDLVLLAWLVSLALARVGVTIREAASSGCVEIKCETARAFYPIAPQSRGETLPQRGTASRRMSKPM